MFPSRQRFSLRKDPNFFHTARKVRGSFFSILYQCQPGDVNVPAQAACIATKKNFPTAVGRNTVKRRVRALLSPLLASAHNSEMVVIVHEPLETAAQRKELQEKTLFVLKTCEKSQ
jgi:ribonuclease P protein component